MISLIAALTQNRVIGKDNDMPWHIPEDLKFFKKTTLGKPMIMGRKTFESLPGLLPKRRHIVVTRQTNLKIEFAELAHSLEEAIDLAAQDNQEIMVIGGAQLYALALPMANRMYLTYIHADIEGDTFFPDFKQEEWQEISREDKVSESGIAFTWVTLERFVLKD
jgi:dihydrofolate reductase